MAKDIRECLLEQARKFHQWQEITYPGKTTEEIGHISERHNAFYVNSRNTKHFLLFDRHYNIQPILTKIRFRCRHIQSIQQFSHSYKFLLRYVSTVVQFFTIVGIQISLREHLSQCLPYSAFGITALANTSCIS